MADKIMFYGTGRRKNAIARVRLVKGKGKITINGRDIDDYFGIETLKVIVKQPLTETNTFLRKLVKHLNFQRDKIYTNIKPSEIIPRVFTYIPSQKYSQNFKMFACFFI